MSTAKLNATGMRSVPELAEFNFKEKCRPGKSSQDCDYLSRNPVEINVQVIQRKPIWTILKYLLIRFQTQKTIG